MPPLSVVKYDPIKFAPAYVYAGLNVYYQVHLLLTGWSALCVPFCAVALKVAPHDGPDVWVLMCNVTVLMYDVRVMIRGS